MDNLQKPNSIVSSFLKGLQPFFYGSASQFVGGNFGLGFFAVSMLVTQFIRSRNPIPKLNLELLKKTSELNELTLAKKTTHRPIKASSLGTKIPDSDNKQKGTKVQPDVEIPDWLFRVSQKNEEKENEVDNSNQPSFFLQVANATNKTGILASEPNFLTDQPITTRSDSFSSRSNSFSRSSSSKELFQKLRNPIEAVGPVGNFVGKKIEELEGNYLLDAKSKSYKENELKNK